MLLIFFVVVGFLIYYQYKKEKRLINLISVLSGPYWVLIPLNNLLVYKLGFLQISDDVILMLTVGLFCFFIGTLPVNNRCSVQNAEEENRDNLLKYNVSWMAFVVFIIALMGLLKLLSMFRSGAFDAVNVDEAEGVMGNGVVGHLMNFSYSIAPFVFLYWTFYPKKIQYLIPILMLVVVTFGTLVKYNIIGLLVTIFMFMMVYRKSLVKKALLFLVIFTVLIFVSNYAFTFFQKGANVDSSFYVDHLWTYASGSLIYDNYVFDTGVRRDVTIWYKLLTFVCALPNMFLSKLYDIKLFPHERQNDLPIAVNSETTSNVVDAFGYIYPSYGYFYEIVCFCVVVMLIGFVSALVYKQGISKSDKIHSYLAIYLSYFVFFSFFGTFYIVSGTWEIMVYALVTPQLFYKRKKKYLCKSE